MDSQSSKESVNNEHEQENEIEDEDEDEENKQIVVKVKREKGKHEVWFKIEPDTQLRWLIIQYCKWAWLDYRATRFVFNGARLRETDTPQQLAMVDCDVIHAFPPDSLLNQGFSLSMIKPNFSVEVVSLSGQRRGFTMNPNNRLTKLMKAYCKSESLDYGDVAFFHCGRKLDASRTAEENGLENRDIIEAIPTPTGGV